MSIRGISAVGRIGRALSCAVLVALGLCAASASAVKVSPSLPPAEGKAPRPGPPVLYEKPAEPAQLENAKKSIWKAPPILVSGAGAQRRGEFLYQARPGAQRRAKRSPTRSTSMPRMFPP
jgi:hypothetical protein